ncbi:MAG: hypothetical protein AB7S26_16750 [Sandaracinaceae bacterium]
MSWVAGPGAWEASVVSRLSDAGITVEHCELSSLTEKVNARAPDLVVLSGAAGSAPASVILELSSSHPASSIPILAIGSSADADPKPRSRYGLIARLDKNAGVDALEKHLRTILRSLSRRPPRRRIEASASELIQTVEQLRSEKRCGLLVAEGIGAIAIDGHGVEPTPERLAAMLRGESQPNLTLHERPPLQLHILSRVGSDATPPSVQGARILVVGNDARRIAKLATRLEQSGAQTRSCPPSSIALSSARSIDPTVIVLSADALLDSGCRGVWEDPRLASAGLVILGEATLRSGSDDAHLLAPVADACRIELGLANRLRSGEALAERLETLGAARWLRLMGRCDGDVTFRVYAATGRGRVDLSDAKMRGAAFRPTDPRMAIIEGRSAIDAMLQLPFGRVLAGPPNKLKALEGVRKSRRTSLVGHLTPEKGTPRPSGRIAAELFVERVSATATDLAQRSLHGMRDAATEPPPGALRSAPRSVVVPKPPTLPPEEGEEDALDALKRELESGAGISSRPPAARSTKRPAAREKTSSVPPSASEPSPPPGKTTPSERPAWALETEETDRGSATSNRATNPAKSKRRKKKKKSSGAIEAASDPPEVVQPTLPRPAAVPQEAIDLAEAEARPAKRSGLGYLAIGAAAIAVGAFAAYRMGVDSTPTEIPVAPGPAVTHASDGTEDPPPDVEPAEPTARPDPPPPDVTEVGPASPDPSDPNAPVEPTQPDIEPGPVEPPPSDTSIDDLLEESLEAARTNHFARSEMLARQILVLSPRNAQAGYRLAVALYRQHRYDEALEWARRTQEWDPTSPLASSLRGDIYIRTGRFRAADDAYVEALGIDEDFGPARRQLDHLRARRRTGGDEPSGSPERHSTTTTPDNPFE